MARLVKKDAMGPTEIKVGGESKWVCMCGLSKAPPYCDVHFALQNASDIERSVARC